MPLIDELYELSDNTALFAHLRTGGELAALGTDPAPPAPKGRNPELLASVREAVVLALRAGDFEQLDALIADSDTSARIGILGELILTLSALAEGKHAEAEQALLKPACGLMVDIAGELDGDPPQDAGDPELLTHGIAMREWAHLFARYFAAKGMRAHEAEALMIRARATNCCLSEEADLVGAAMVEAARAIEALGQTEMPAQCYRCVRTDLRYVLTHREVFPPYEMGCVLHWLELASREQLRFGPDSEAEADLGAARLLRQEFGTRPPGTEPRFGPIARTYLEHIPYLAHIVRDIQTGYDGAREDESVAALCERYGCSSTEVEAYVHGVNTYYVRQTVLRGVHVVRDTETNQDIFAAIRYLERQRAEPGGG